MTAKNRPKFELDRYFPSVPDKGEFNKYVPEYIPSDIPASYIYQEDDALDKLFNVLDYPGNVSRSFIMGLGKGKALKYASQALDKDRYTPESSIKDKLTKSLGMGKIRFGEDDGAFQWGDIPDIALDVATGIATDPLTIVGISPIARASQIKKLGTTGKAAKTASGAKLVTGAAMGAGAAPKDATTAERGLYAVGGATMGKYGATLARQGSRGLAKSGDKLTDWYATFTRGPKFSDFSKSYKAASDALEKKADIKDRIIFGRLHALKGLSLKEKSEATDFMRMTKEFTAKQRHHYEKVIKSKYLLKEIPPYLGSSIDDMANRDASRFIDSLTMEASPKVNNAVKKWAQHNKDTVELYNKTHDRHTIKTMLADIPSQDRREFIETLRAFEARKRRVYRKLADSQKIGTLSNERKQAIGQKAHLAAEKYLDQLVEEKKSKLSSSLSEWISYEKDSHKKALPLIGVKYHVEDIADKFLDADLSYPKEISNKIKRMKTGRGLDEKLDITPRKKGAFAGDLTYEIYADKMSSSFLKDHEVKAINLVKDYQDFFKRGQIADGSQPKGSLVQTVLENGGKPSDIVQVASSTNQSSWRKMRGLAGVTEVGLNLFDDLQRLAKSNMLMFSTTWLANNFYDNALKSYVENGLAGAVDAFTMRALRKNIGKDIWAIYNNKAPTSLAQSDVVNEARKYGVLDSNLFQDLADKVKDSSVLISPDRPDKRLVRRMSDDWIKLLSNTTGRVGSTIEGAARVSFYARTKEALKKANPAIAEEILRREAARMTDDVFFDYATDSNAFEKAVMKRIVPFWSFHKNNIGYWADALFEPLKVRRMADVGRVHQAIGHDPTKDDYRTMPLYMRHRQPRDIGNDKYAVLSNLSPTEAYRTSQAEFLDKISPIILAVPELAMNWDSFTGSTLYPEKRDEKKYLFSRGFKWYVLQELIQRSFEESTGKKRAELFGIRLEKGKDPVISSKKATIAAKLFDTLFPTPVLDQIFGSGGKVLTDRESVAESLINRFSPVKTVRVSQKMREYIRKKKRNETR